MYLQFGQIVKGSYSLAEVAAPVAVAEWIKEQNGAVEAQETKLAAEYWQLTEQKVDTQVTDVNSQ